MNTPVIFLNSVSHGSHAAYFRFENILLCIYVKVINQLHYLYSSLLLIHWFEHIHPVTLEPAVNLQYYFKKFLPNIA